MSSPHAIHCCLHTPTYYYPLSIIVKGELGSISLVLVVSEWKKEAGTVPGGVNFHCDQLLIRNNDFFFLLPSFVYSFSLSTALPLRLDNPIDHPILHTSGSCPLPLLAHPPTMPMDDAINSFNCREHELHEWCF